MSDIGDVFSPKAVPVRAHRTARSTQALLSQHEKYTKANISQIVPDLNSYGRIPVMFSHKNSRNESSYDDAINNFSEMLMSRPLLGDIAFLYITGHSSCESTRFAEVNTQRISEYIKNNVKIISLTDTCCRYGSNIDTQQNSFELLHETLLSENANDDEYLNFRFQEMVGCITKEARENNTAIHSEVSTLHSIGVDENKNYMDKRISYNSKDSREDDNKLRGAYLIFVVNGNIQVINLASSNTMSSVFGIELPEIYERVEVTNSLFYTEYIKKRKISPEYFIIEDDLVNDVRITTYCMIAEQLFKKLTNKTIQLKVIDASCSTMKCETLESFLHHKYDTLARGKKHTKKRRNTKRRNTNKRNTNKRNTNKRNTNKRNTNRRRKN